MYFVIVNLFPRVPTKSKLNKLINYSLTELERCEKVYAGLIILIPPPSLFSNNCAGRWISQFSADHFTHQIWWAWFVLIWWRHLTEYCCISTQKSDLEAGPIDKFLKNLYVCDQVCVHFISQYCANGFKCTIVGWMVHSNLVQCLSNPIPIQGLFSHSQKKSYRYAYESLYPVHQLSRSDKHEQESQKKPGDRIDFGNFIG